MQVYSSKAIGLSFKLVDEGSNLNCLRTRLVDQVTRHSARMLRSFVSSLPHAEDVFLFTPPVSCRDENHNIRVWQVREVVLVSAALEAGRCEGGRDCGRRPSHAAGHVFPHRWQSATTNAHRRNHTAGQGPSKLLPPAGHIFIHPLRHDHNLAVASSAQT